MVFKKERHPVDSALLLKIKKLLKYSLNFDYLID